ncbi:hypothetical protein [uncultured Lactobacillus sp.]|uniref:hypothetical protein n=1 Tax=uncultured Lactobacillus sp. TaxID=153152 RepID=UPI002605C612|nr:hypothetical protein [uncultured Lactobacillus sp.]
MQKLNKFTSVSDEKLSKVNGGDNADYNMGYECGRDARRFTNGLVRWWNQHFFARREMN